VDDTHRDIRGVAGVMVSTSPARYAAMEVFYVQLFGPALRSRRDGFVNFDWGGVRVTVTLHDGVDGTSVEPQRLMINLLVDDADAAEQRARDLGAPVVRPASAESWGGRICTVEDPDGNYLQFMQLR
jgi:predicted enzyme related to lactoylglutathione lyase